MSSFDCCFLRWEELTACLHADKIWQRGKIDHTGKKGRNCWSMVFKVCDLDTKDTY